MNKVKKESCCSLDSKTSSLNVMIDPVCGMKVSENAAYYIDDQTHRYFFCCMGCKAKFEQNPEQYATLNLKIKPCDPEQDNAVEVSTARCCDTKHHVVSQQPKKKSCCDGASEHPQNEDKSIKQEIDPVCGMSVSREAPLNTVYKDQNYYFCNPSCLDKFKRDPEFYLVPLAERPIPKGAIDTDYTCPMDPEIVQKGPGTCPICGMALEPMQPSLEEGPNPELADFNRRFWITLPFSIAVMFLAMGSHIRPFIPPYLQPWIELVLSLPVVLWAGYPILQRCWVSYRTWHLNMWSLIGVGILAAFSYSVIATIFPSVIPIDARSGHAAVVYFEAACMIVSLSLLGQIMELKARAQTADSLKELLKLQPNTAKRIVNNIIEDVEIEKIKKGDVLQISSGEQIPLDGLVIAGQTYVDESMMTGEFLPIKKDKNDQVIGGTINQQGMIRVRTTAVGTHTTLSKMIQTVAEAQRSKAPLQRIADVVARYFVIAVLGMSLLTFIAWITFGQARFDLALMCAVAVLIIACPCALGLATPMSIMAVTGRAAQKGVLFKDAETLELFSKVDTLILDKTGTLTMGKPILKEIKLLSNQLTIELVEQYIRSLEQYSTHPIAKILTEQFLAHQRLDVSDFEDLVGFGVKGILNEESYYIGSQKLIETMGLSLDPSLEAELNQLREEGHLISFFATNSTILAYIVIHDAIKENAKTMIDQLREKHVEVIMATGDHEKNAQLLARKLGISQVYSHLTPQQKLDLVKQCQAKNKIVAMAGDGINDAPALAQAHVGIAMGTGTDIAKQTAQVTLIHGDIYGINSALYMARQGVKNMKQNLALSFLYNGLGVPLAAGIFYPLTGWLLTPMIAAIAMSLSSLSVVLNALRLKKL